MTSPSPTRAEGRFSLRLFAAFLAVALAFVGSSVYSNLLAIEIGFEARQLTDNALPSSEHLMAALDGLRDLESATDDYPDLAPAERAAARKDIEASWQRVDGELGAYLAYPMLPRERELYRDVAPALRELDVAMQRLFGAVDAATPERDVDAVDHEVRVQANRSADLLRQLVQVNAGHAAESSRRIEGTRHRILVVDGVLNGVLLVLTLAVAAWMWRVFRSYARLQHLHAELVERRAEELEVFGRRVAHDLLSPLSSLTFCLGAFKQVSQGNAKLEGALGRARQCVQRAHLLVDSVLDFATSGGTPSPEARVEVPDVVAQIVEETRAVDPAERPEVVCGSIPACAVKCSRGVLASILGNLVRNAVKFMRDSAVRQVTLRVIEAGAFVRFEVEDTGPGVPPGLERTIFEPYVRGQGVTQPGLGLGLATVKRFCEAHGGTVGVRPSEGPGATFYFTLPKAPDTAPQASSVRLVRDTG